MATCMWLIWWWSLALYLHWSKPPDSTQPKSIFASDGICALPAWNYIPLSDVDLDELILYLGKLAFPPPLVCASAGLQYPSLHCHYTDTYIPMTPIEIFWHTTLLNHWKPWSYQKWHPLSVTFLWKLGSEQSSFQCTAVWSSHSSFRRRSPPSQKKMFCLHQILVQPSAAPPLPNFQMQKSNY